MQLQIDYLFKKFIKIGAINKFENCILSERKQVAYKEEFLLKQFKVPFLNFFENNYEWLNYLGKKFGMGNIAAFYAYK